MAEPAVRTELPLSRISCKPTRDILRQAARQAARGPVWIVRRDGTPIAAIVPPEQARFLEEMRESLARAERGETVDLGSFAQYADDD